ncbi:MAG TPA: thioredoxin family protein [Candidatus Paceibacterota bacterium]|nr:thioredoxin family protein [Verrucomicrobiota bacterium]HRY50954.1 thioredoxin family protein [Candidatus Paceibacterota bacterium]
MLFRAILILTFIYGLQLPANAQTLNWIRNKEDAMATAKAEGKLVLMLAGRDTCSNCKTMKNTVAETANPPIKELLLEHFILWYSVVDTSPDYKDYDDGLRAGWGLPLICVINPNNPAAFLSRSTGVQQAAAFYPRLVADVSTLPPPLPPPPVITGFEPASGSVGATVTIQGNYLTNVTAVEFNGVAATFALEDGLKAVVPTNATTGPIVVKTASGVATSSGPFQVVVITPYESTADLGVAVQGETFVRDGEVRALFKVTITNYGPQTASGIVVSNILSHGIDDAEPEVMLWQPHSLAPNAWTSFCFEVGHSPTTNWLCQTIVKSSQPDLVVENNTVTTSPQPRLGISQSAPDSAGNPSDKITLAWPGGDAGWKLQSADLLAGLPFVWESATEVPVQQPVQYQVDVPKTGAAGSRIYRLSK